MIEKHQVCSGYTTNLCDLPVEVLLIIFSHLDYRDLIRLRGLNTRLKEAASQEMLWKALVERYWLETELPKNHTLWREYFVELYKDLHLYIDCYRHIKTQWNKIIGFVEKHCPLIHRTIKSGCTEKLLGDVEKKLGMRYPVDLRCSYRICNGQKLTAPGLMGTMLVADHYESESLLDLETSAMAYQSHRGLDGCIPLTFCMYSGVSAYYALTDVDGYTPESVFYVANTTSVSGASRRDLDVFISAQSFTEWITNYADMLHRNLYPVVNNQIYRFYQEPSCVATTGPFVVSAATCFVPERSTVNPPYFLHAYRITMRMSPSARVDDTCQLETRHWIITDENGHEERVDGRGVVGEFPVMFPGAEYSWNSCTMYKTTYGNMKGYFTLRNLKTDESIDVECPVYHMKCLPYLKAEERIALVKEREALKKAQ